MTDSVKLYKDGKEKVISRTMFSDTDSFNSAVEFWYGEGWEEIDLRDIGPFSASLPESADLVCGSSKTRLPRFEELDAAMIDEACDDCNISRLQFQQVYDFLSSRLNKVD